MLWLAKVNQPEFMWCLHSCIAELSKWLVMLMWTMRLQEEGNSEGRLHEEEEECLGGVFCEGEVIKYICLTGAYVYTGGTNSNEYFWPSPRKCLLSLLDSNCQVFSWCSIECVKSYSQEISLDWLEQNLLIKALYSSPQVSGWVRNASTQKTSQGGKCLDEFLVNFYSLRCRFIQHCVGRGASASCLSCKYKLSLWINKASSWAWWEADEAFG